MKPRHKYNCQEFDPFPIEKKKKTQKQHRHKALQIRNSKELNKAKTQTCKDFGHRGHQTLRYTIIMVTQIKQKQGEIRKKGSTFGNQASKTSINKNCES